jgi:hypothetical protein
MNEKALEIEVTLFPGLNGQPLLISLTCKEFLSEFR